jgi:transposase
LDRWPSNLQINGHATGRVEVLHGPERRRRWSAEEKARIVAESFEPGTVVSSVARRHGLHRNQLYAWRRELQEGEFDVPASGVTFAPIVLTDTSAPVRLKDIEIALGGAVVRVGVGADLGLLSDILRLLKPSA